MGHVKLQPAAFRRLRSDARSSETGQTLIEVLVAALIFAIVAASLIGVLTTGVNITSLARQKTLAERDASTQIEKIRNLPYASVGNVAGNPAGSVNLTTAISVAGLAATMTTKISYVNDPTPLSYQSYANYKRVTVTIARSSDSKQLAQEVTNIAPPVKASQSLATAPFSVVDIGNNTVVPNVTVSLANGPSAPESDTTDASGQVTFAGLTPTSGSQPYYDASVTLPSGYVALSDTQSPAAVAHFSLAPGQILPVGTLKIYQPATIYVQLKKFDGSNYTGSANVTISSTRGTSSALPYTSPQMTWTALNGEPLVPGLNYTVTVTAAGFLNGTSSQTVPTSYPTNLTSTFVFTQAQAPINTVLPTISGTAAVGQTLTATNGTWNGTAPIAYGYQWQDCNGASCVGIPGATSSTYTVQGSDAGYSIQVIVTATNVVGSTNATSANTAVITGPPFNVGLPNISGTAKVGNVLTATPGTWAGNTPISYAYQWQRCSPSCSNIAGATSATYSIVAADAGSTLLVKVAATNAYGTGNATSANTGTVLSPPVNTVLPVISGTLQPGNTLSTTNGSWSGSPTGYTYQWQRCAASCTSVGGATNNTYFVTTADVGSKLRVIVTATNGGGSANATSNSTATVTVTYAASVTVLVTNTSGTKCGGAGVVISGGAFDSATTVSATTSSASGSGKGIATFSNNVPTNPSGGTPYTIQVTSSSGRNATGSMTAVGSGSNTGPTIQVSKC